MRRMSWLERSGTYPDSSSMHTLPCAKDHDILSRLFIGIYKPLLCRDRRKRGYIRLSNSEASEYINPSMFQKSSCTAVPSSFYITILHRKKKILTTIMMKSLASIAIGAAALASVASATVKGFDISHYQPTVDFAKAYSDGARFVIIKVGIAALFLVML